MREEREFECEFEKVNVVQDHREGYILGNLPTVKSASFTMRS